MVTFWDAFTNIVGPVLLVFAASYIWLGDTPMFAVSEGFAVAALSAESFISLYRWAVGTLSIQIAADVLLIVPLVAGLLQFARLTKYRWLARYPIALQAGIGVGLTFGMSIQGYLIDYVASGTRSLITGTPDPISGVIVVIAAITVMFYYLYSTKIGNYFHEKSGGLNYILKLGRIFMMFSFSYLYLDMYFNEGVMHIPLFYSKLIKFPLEVLFGIKVP
jgi:hypothetical protein